VRDLVPVAKPGEMDRLIQHLLPKATWPLQDWRPLHPRAWRRQFSLPAWITLALTLVLTLR
jgi:putative membrane protein